MNNGNWDEVERYATALEQFTRPEPLPWSDLFIARGRALVTIGRGRLDSGNRAELRRILNEANRVGLKLAIPVLDTALTEFENHIVEK